MLFGYPPFVSKSRQETRNKVLCRSPSSCVSSPPCTSVHSPLHQRGALEPPRATKLTSCRRPADPLVAQVAALPHQASRLARGHRLPLAPHLRARGAPRLSHVWRRRQAPQLGHRPAALGLPRRRRTPSRSRQRRRRRAARPCLAPRHRLCDPAPQDAAVRPAAPRPGIDQVLRRRHRRRAAPAARGRTGRPCARHDARPAPQASRARRGPSQVAQRARFRRLDLQEAQAAGLRPAQRYRPRPFRQDGRRARWREGEVEPPSDWRRVVLHALALCLDTLPLYPFLSVHLIPLFYL